MRLGVFLVIAALAGPGSAAEEDVRLSADVDAREVGVEEQVQLTISVSGRGLSGREQLTFPALKNLRLVGGPMQSDQLSIVNGVVSQGKTYTWVLQPVSAGKAEIGAVRIHLSSGTEKTTEPIALTVVSDGARSRARAGGAGRLGQDPFSGADPFGADPFDGFFGRSRARGPAPKIAAEVTASRRKVHVGEPLRLAYQVYTQTGLTAVDFTEEPKHAGFWAEDIGRPGAAARRGEAMTLDGERYVRFTVSEKLLFPMKSGQLAIPAARLRIGVARASFFDAGGSVERETKPLTIEVEPNPAATELSGAVGQFKASASLDKTSIALGEAATLRFTLAGHGNLRWIERGPAIELPNVKVYPPQLKDAIKVEASGMDGSRTWEYVLVPQTGGKLDLPPLALTYFDPAAERISRAETAALTLEVAPTPGAASARQSPATTAVNAPTGLALRADLESGATAAVRLETRGLIAVGVLVVLAHAMLWIGGRGGSASRARASGAPGRTSVRAALAEIERARAKGTSKEQSALLIEKALADVFGPLESAGAVTGNAREQAALEVLNEVRFLRYAPQLGDYSDKIREVAERAAEVVRRGA